MAEPAKTQAQAGGERNERLYVVLASIFIASLIAANLVFQKFFQWDLTLFGWEIRFQQSVGILVYPVTFLVTDILSEIYGQVRATRVVVGGLFASVFVVLLLLVADWMPATSWSPVDSDTFHRVFGLSWIAVGASMIAYLVAQLCDIRMFHFWKRLTQGKHLWLRNNASTIASQVVDTALVNGLLAAYGVPGVTWELFPALFINGVMFKWIVALLDTPLFYLSVWFCSRESDGAAER